MKMLAKVGAALQHLLGTVAEQVAERTGVIQRQREFSVLSLSRTFVLGYLANPNSSVAELAVMAVEAGAVVSPQAVDQRRTPRLVEFLKQLFQESLKILVKSPESVAPILERFSEVTIIDSTTITLPDSQKECFQGCGGISRTSQSAIKLQTELDLRSGALAHIEIESGKSPDGATCRQHVRRGPGSLRISDLGYFNVAVFAAMAAAQEFFLSRLQFNTGVLSPEGVSLSTLQWLASQSGALVDQPILLGIRERIPCRLIAWRVPEELANRRRQKVREEIKRKRGKEPSTERLAWCNWSILVTNVPGELLTPTEAMVVYRARWQIELLFKRWKSLGLIAALDGTSDVRTMVKVWSRLIACVVEHWLLVGTVWGDARISLPKAARVIRGFAPRIASLLPEADDLLGALKKLTDILLKTCRRNQRTNPGTFELLNKPALLNYRLT